MKALTVFNKFQKSFQAIGGKTSDISLTEDGIYSEVSIDGVEYAIFITPKFLIRKEDLYTQQDQNEELYY